VLYGLGRKGLAVHIEALLELKLHLFDIEWRYGIKGFIPESGLKVLAIIALVGSPGLLVLFGPRKIHVPQVVQSWDSVCPVLIDIELISHHIPLDRGFRFPGDGEVVHYPGYPVAFD
jgi:hypothetical protein